MFRARCNAALQVCIILRSNRLQISLIFLNSFSGKHSFVDGLLTSLMFC